MFDGELVAYSLIAQNLAAWFRQERLFGFKEALARSVNRERASSEIFGFTPSLEWFCEYHRRLFGDQVLNEPKFLDSISDPRQVDTLVNKVVAARTALRNNFIKKKCTSPISSDTILVS